MRYSLLFMCHFLPFAYMSFANENNTNKNNNNKNNVNIFRNLFFLSIWIIVYMTICNLWMKPSRSNGWTSKILAANCMIILKCRLSSENRFERLYKKRSRNSSTENPSANERYTMLPLLILLLVRWVITNIVNENGFSREEKNQSVDEYIDENEIQYQRIHLTLTINKCHPNENSARNNILPSFD